MEKKRVIPYNYKNNGRFLNMIEKKAVTKALCYFIPACFLIFQFMPVRIDNKFFFAIIFGCPPAVAFCLEFDVMLMDIINFKKNRRVYYDMGKERLPNDKSYKATYERAKLAENRN